MLIYYGVINLFTFLLWGFDKTQAIRHNYRVPEKWLFILTLLGGCFGALAGMLVFRHKTRKTLFWVLVGLACVIHLGIIIGSSVIQ